MVGTAADTSSSIVYEDGANPGQYITKRYSPRGVPAWVPAKNRAGTPINTFVLLMAHMIDVGQTVYSFYSSNLSITDINGTTIPAGAYVNAYNPNNSTFYLQVISSDATYPAWVKVVTNGSGGFNQTTYTPELRRDSTRSTTPPFPWEARRRRGLRSMPRTE